MMELEKKRRALLKVKEILKELDCDFICVVEGASITHTTHEGIIKDLRQKLVQHEEDLLEDPNHDWSKELK